MMPTVAIALAVAITYAVNTWKIRLVAGGRSVAAAMMEATQGFLYVYVLIEILGSADSALGIAAYVVGAFVGTLGAMLLSNRSREPVGRHQDCCPSCLVPGSPLGPTCDLSRSRPMLATTTRRIP
jgi:hypothetical protein